LAEAPACHPLRDDGESSDAAFLGVVPYQADQAQLEAIAKARKES